MTASYQGLPESVSCDDSDVLWADRAFAVASISVYALYNVVLFGRPLCRLATTEMNARPTWLPEHKVYVPLSKVFAIDIWADTIMKKAEDKPDAGKGAGKGATARPKIQRQASMGWGFGAWLRRDSWDRRGSVNKENGDAQMEVLRAARKTAASHTGAMLTGTGAGTGAGAGGSRLDSSPSGAGRRLRPIASSASARVHPDNSQQQK